MTNDIELPQGSALRPLLSMLYVNGISNIALSLLISHVNFLTQMDNVFLIN